MQTAPSCSFRSLLYINAKFSQRGCGLHKFGYNQAETWKANQFISEKQKHNCYQQGAFPNGGIPFSTGPNNATTIRMHNTIEQYTIVVMDGFAHSSSSMME